MYKAEKCFKVLLQYQLEHQDTIKVDFSELLAKSLAVHNYVNKKNPKDRTILHEIMEPLINNITSEISSSTDAISYAHQCEKVFVGIILTKFDDQELNELFDQILDLYKLKQRPLPSYLLKACTIGDKSEYLSKLLSSESHMDVDYESEVMP